MQFSIPTAGLIALFLATTGTLAAPSSDAAPILDARANCNSILPACNGGRVVGQTNCRCRGQVSACDLWSCPGGAPNVMVCGQQGSGCVFI